MSPDPADPGARAIRAAAFAQAHCWSAAALRGGVGVALGRLAESLAAADRLAREAAAAESRRAACRAGCGWCCHQPVEVGVPELLFIAGRTGPPPAAAGRACPFLDPAGGCRIYPIRPFACRGLWQPDPRWCMATFAKVDPPADAGPAPIDHRPLAAPRAAHSGAQAGVAQAFHEAGFAVPGLAFAPALAWLAAHPAAEGLWRSGGDPFPERVRLRRSQSGVTPPAADGRG